jgi:hypothetical protein
MMTLGLSDPAFLGAMGAVGYDTDAQTYITAVEAADGQTLETAVKDAINAFVINCKSDGTWNAIKACCIMAGARTIQGCLVPLVGPTPTRSGSSAGWNYDRKTGLKADGSTNLIDSGLAASSNAQNNVSGGVWVSTAPTAMTYAAYMGAGSGQTGSFNLFNDTGRIATRCHNTAANIFGAGTSSATGFIGMSRSSASIYSVRFSSANNTLTQASEAPISNNISIFRVTSPVPTNDNSTYSNGRYAFYYIGQSLDMALLQTRISALITAIAAAIP